MQIEAATTYPWLGQHSLFRECPQLLQQISSQKGAKIYAKHDIVLHHGDAATSLWLVLKGWVKLSRQTPDGKESVIGLCTEGDIFGEAALFAFANYPYHVEVLAAHTELLAIPSAILRPLLAENTALNHSIMATLSERTSQAQLKLEQLNTMSAAQRLGCFLLRLCYAQAEGQKTIHIPVGKHILAAYLGMKPETLSRSQQQLKSLGVAVEGATIAIPNIGRLRSFVCNSCSESGSCDVEDAAE